ncbi:MAG: MGMT family protein [Desulfobulbaceae bacterium]|nr:MGMT family protein [Desulfobulbaceae bacterium]
MRDLRCVMGVEKDGALTDFQRKVYAVVSQIPKGRVMTYQGVARALGCRSCQAVGQALKRNPFAPTVPCHRVIKSDFSLGGFAGAWQGDELVRKMKLLADEGVIFENGRLQNPELIVVLPLPNSTAEKQK